MVAAPPLRPLRVLVIFPRSCIVSKGVVSWISISWTPIDISDRADSLHRDFISTLDNDVHGVTCYTGMFGLRSSPSTFVPCSLRGAVTAEAGMGFGARGLTIPRPKRVVMPIVYYDSGASGCSCAPCAAGGTGVGQGGGCSSSDYTGVFESGCDPAQVRASLQPRTPMGHSLEEESSGGNYYNNVLDDESTDCLFPMDGPEGHPKDTLYDGSKAVSNAGGSHGNRSSGLSEPTNIGTGRVTAMASSGAPGPRVGGGLGYGGSNAVPYRGVSSAAPAAGVTPPSHRSEALVPKTTHVRRAHPRTIAPGRRCMASGMYRLRLSTSC